MNNYELSRDRAQEYFLRFSQEAILAQWQLSADETWLYADFLGQPYRIHRQKGTVYRCRDNTQADHAEVLSLFDLLCHEGTCKQISGNFAPVNSLKGRPRAIGVGTDFHTETAGIFDRDPETFRKACIALGGTPVPMGDMGFRFPVFGPLEVIVKFYRADEDFPASLTLLWDDQTLQFLYYETVFYIAGFLLSCLTDKFREITPSR